MAGAFQQNAFQNNAWQTTAAAFQRCAFQYGAYQTLPCPTPTPVTGTGGGGMGWSRERELLELSLEMRQAQATLRKSARPQAKAVARKLADYAAERISLAALQAEYQALLRRVGKAEMEADLRQAAVAMEAFIRDENEALIALALSLDMDARFLGALHGDIAGSEARTH